MSQPAVKYKVRRGRPLFGLYTPSHWWEVRATEFQTIAKFTTWHDAYAYAYLRANSDRGRYTIIKPKETR